jgi:nucleoside-diphosphate-sugar epimerase
MNNSTRLLVTGANGFIGGRVLERAVMSGHRSACAGVHTWSGAARVGRLGCEVRACDLLDEHQVAKTLDGIKAVIHCAAGPARSMVEGTRILLEHALGKGVERFVHLSTCDVYGATAGKIAEDHELGARGKGYAAAKREVELLCWEYSNKGLPLVVLRPSIVYGPFSKSWSIRYATRMLAGKWGTLGEAAEGYCNLIYVDDLAMAALTAVDHPNAVGQAFNINSDDIVTWNEYWDRFSSAMGRGPLQPQNATWLSVRTNALRPVRSAAQVLMKHFRRQIFRIYSNNYAARGVMQATESTLSMTPTVDELKLYRKQARFDNAKAKAVLGFTPQVNLTQGLEYTVAWLRHHDYLPEPALVGATST